MSSDKEITVIRQFENVKRELERWGQAVDNQIIAVLKRARGFDYAWVKQEPNHRIKDNTSYLRKALYRPKSTKYADPLLEIEDKVGTRVILLTTQQVYAVKYILQNDSFWDYQVGRDFQSDQKKFPTQFDYQAVHLVVKPLKTSTEFAPELRDYLTCEIQIKTVFQQAYSDVSHDTVYKGPFRTEPLLIRTLSKAMALLEAVDDYLGILFEMISRKDLWTISFMRELTSIYRQINPDFQDDQADGYLTDAVLAIAEDAAKPDKIDFGAVEEFAQKNKSDLQQLVQDKSFYLASQPIVVLLAYLVENHNRTLQSKWDLDKNILDRLYVKMGYAPED
jgi:ppGpp synthetase/RelA/SpoT-type nucleotidyltranferase